MIDKLRQNWAIVTSACTGIVIAFSLAVGMGTIKSQVEFTQSAHAQEIENIKLEMQLYRSLGAELKTTNEMINGIDKRLDRIERMIDDLPNRFKVKK